jgi:hypothetical protein
VLLAGVGLIASICLSGGTELVSAEPSPEALPVGTVAVVSHAPWSFGTITEPELARTISQVSAAAGLQAPPESGTPKWRRIEEEALGELLATSDLEGEAAARHLIVTRTEVSTELAAIKAENFRSEAQYRRFKRHAKFTEAEVRERIRLQIISGLIEEDVTRSVDGEAAQMKALQKFVAVYEKRWRARTVCAPEYAIEGCSNGPEPTG